MALEGFKRIEPKRNFTQRFVPRVDGVPATKLGEGVSVCIIFEHIQHRIEHDKVINRVSSPGSGQTIAQLVQTGLLSIYPRKDLGKEDLTSYNNLGLLTLRFKGGRESRNALREAPNDAGQAPGESGQQRARIFDHWPEGNGRNPRPSIAASRSRRQSLGIGLRLDEAWFSSRSAL